MKPETEDNGKEKERFGILERNRKERLIKEMIGVKKTDTFYNLQYFKLRIQLRRN